MTSRTLKNTSVIATSALILLLSGCASMENGANYRPIVDGGDLTHYDADLAACQQVATQREYLNDETKADAAIGAAIGALAGADGNGGELLGGALVGGAIGAAGGAFKARTERKNIVINCMKQRGYNTVESTYIVE